MSCSKAMLTPDRSTYKIQNHFQNVMLVGKASEIRKTTYKSVWIAQDTMESRVPRLNVHTNQILVHTLFSHGTLDSVVALASVITLAIRV